MQYFVRNSALTTSHWASCALLIVFDVADVVLVSDIVFTLSSAKQTLPISGQPSATQRNAAKTLLSVSDAAGVMPVSDMVFILARAHQNT